MINTDNGNYFLSRYFHRLFQRKIRGLDLRKWMLRMKIFPRFDAIENTSILKLIFDYLQDVEDLFSSVSKQERIQEIYNRSKIHFSRDLKGEIIALPPDSCYDTLAQISSSTIHKSTGFLLFNDALLQTPSDYKLCLQIFIYTRNSNVFLKHAFQRNLTLIIPIFFRLQ